MLAGLLVGASAAALVPGPAVAAEFDPPRLNGAQLQLNTDGYDRAMSQLPIGLTVTGKSFIANDVAPGLPVSGRGDRPRRVHTDTKKMTGTPG